MRMIPPEPTWVELCCVGSVPTYLCVYALVSDSEDDGCRHRHQGLARGVSRLRAASVTHEDSHSVVHPRCDHLVRVGAGVRVPLR